MAHDSWNQPSTEKDRSNRQNMARNSTRQWRYYQTEESLCPREAVVLWNLQNDRFGEFSFRQKNKLFSFLKAVESWLANLQLS